MWVCFLGWTKKAMWGLNWLFSGKKSFERAIKQGGDWKAMKQETLALETSSIIHAIKMKWLTMPVGHFLFVALLVFSSLQRHAPLILSWLSGAQHRRGTFRNIYFTDDSCRLFEYENCFFALCGHKRPLKDSGKNKTLRSFKLSLIPFLTLQLQGFCPLGSCEMVVLRLSVGAK